LQEKSSVDGAREAWTSILGAEKVFWVEGNKMGRGVGSESGQEGRKEKGNSAQKREVRCEDKLRVWGPWGEAGAALKIAWKGGGVEKGADSEPRREGEKSGNDEKKIHELQT